MKTRRLHIILSIALFFISASASAQTPTDSVPGDPAVHVYTLQNLKFGAFATGNSGGTVSISPQGDRSSSGSVVLFNYLTYTNAVFEIEAPPSIIVSFNNGPDVQLNGSNGGTMTLSLGSSDPASPFVNQYSPPQRTQIKLGATLTVGVPPTTVQGTYSGNFYITINQQ